MTFIDFEKAFDSVKTEIMWLTLQEYGIPRKITQITKILYDGFKCKISHEGNLSDFIEIRNGVRIFSTAVKSALLYACETGKTTNQITRRLQIFVNKRLRRILNIKWTCKITTKELWRTTHQKSIENQIKRRKWNWIGHALRKEVGAIEKTALDWNPQGYRRRGRPKRTWRKTIEDEIRSTRRSWNEVEGIAGDRNAWKLFMDPLCCTRSKRI